VVRTGIDGPDGRLWAARRSCVDGSRADFGYGGAALEGKEELASRFEAVIHLIHHAANARRSEAALPSGARQRAKNAWAGLFSLGRNRNGPVTSLAPAA
jgi:hypothetical protein